MYERCIVLHCIALQPQLILYWFRIVLAIWEVKFSGSPDKLIGPRTVVAAIIVEVGAVDGNV